MKTWKIGGWIFLYLSLICLFCNTVTAQSLNVVDLSITPDRIWLHKNPNTITISAKCEYGGSIVNAKMWAQIIFPKSGGISTSPMQTGIFEYETITTFPDTGDYTVRVNCTYGEHSASATGKFVAHKLELSTDHEGDLETHLGGDLLLKLKFKYDGTLITPKRDTFSVYLGANGREDRLELTEDPILVENHQQVKVKIPMHSDRISNGLYDLRVEGKYSDDEIIILEKKKFVWVNNPLEIYMVERDIRHVIGDSPEKKLTAKVVFKAGDIMDLDIENVEIVVSNESVSKKAVLDSIDCDRDTEICSFSFDIPSFAISCPGLYDLDLTIAYPSITSYRHKATESIPLKEMLRISGSMKDALEKGIKTQIIVESIDSGEIEEIDTKSNGDYSIDLLPGNYNFVFNFAGGTVIKIFNVSISGVDLLSLPGDMIRYDQDHINSEIPSGMNLVRIIVLELALPHSSVRFYMPYDSSRVGGDENDIGVYQCERWNFERSLCSGGWGKVGDVAVHTIKDAMEFNASSYGAFMIGENDMLRFSALIFPDKGVTMGGEVEVKGKVVDSRGEPVNGATIRASFLRHDGSSTTKTNIEGSFVIKVNAPYFEGGKELLVEASKDLFVSCNSTQMIDIGRKTELSILNVPDMIDVQLGDTNDFEFALFNSGQVNLTETIYIHLAGISTDWYELLPEQVEGLDTNGQIPIMLRIKITPELCGGGCGKFYLVNLEAKSDEAIKTASFTIRIPQPPKNETEYTEEEEEGISESPAVTGFSILLPSFSDPYLLLTIMVILLFLIVNKKKTRTGRNTFGKQGKTGHELRSSVISSLSRIKKNI
jgi:hypothetical protein